MPSAISEENTNQQPILPANPTNQNLSTVVSGASLVFLGFIISRGLEIITRSVIARYLGPEDFGIFSTSFSFLSILGTVILVGLPLGIVRFIAQYSEAEERSRNAIISAAFWFALITGVIIGALLWILANNISESLFHASQMAPAIRIIGLSLPLFGLLTIISSIFQAKKAVRSHVMINSFVLPIARLLLASVAICLGLSVYGVITQYFTIAIGATLFLSLFLFHRNLASLFTKVRNPKHILWELLRFSIPLMLGALLSTGVWQLDVLLLQSLKSSTETGIYSAALTLGRIPNMILLAFGFMTTPFMARLYHENQLEALRTLYGQTVDLIFMIVLPISVFFLCFAPQIINLFYGDLYTQSSHVFRLVTIGYFFHSILGPNGNTLVMIGRSRLYLVDTLLMATVSVFLYFVLIPIKGGSGAAIATIAGLFLLNILFTVQLFRLVRINSLQRIRYRLILPVSLAGILAFMIGKITINLAPWLQLGLITMIFFLGYVGFTFWFGLVKPEEIKKLGQELLQKRRLKVN